MRALIQRVSAGKVVIDGAAHAEIGRGLVILAGVEVTDTSESIAAMVRKVTGLRIFDDAAGKTNLSCEDVGGEYLCVSQFTLCADLSKGKRPGFENAMKPPRSQELFDEFCKGLTASTRRPVRTGVFGATMTVEIKNEGPATYLLQM
ncbi:MAG TPA: D-aminoacyl-tRNA deacylase [Planctomycetota bacterium]|nr:D-aminoacyl-tRNA deacylase [Planctomycetota bacterium]